MVRKVKGYSGECMHEMVLYMDHRVSGGFGGSTGRNGVARVEELLMHGLHAKPCVPFMTR